MSRSVKGESLVSEKVALRGSKMNPKPKNISRDITILKYPMEDNEIKCRVENGLEWYYYGHYCKYCKRCINTKYVARHNKTDEHKNNQIIYKHDKIHKQISKRLVKDFKEGRYDLNDPNLVGEERKERFKQLNKETWEKYEIARKDGYFDKLDYDESIDFIEYAFYHRMGIKQGHPTTIFGKYLFGRRFEI